MPELDVYALPNFREVIKAAYAPGGPLAVTQEEIAASSGFSGSHLSNARGRTRRLTQDQGVRLGRALWLDVDGARTFGAKIRLATAGEQERDAIRAELAALEAARHRAVAEGCLFERAPSLPPPVELHAPILPPLFYRTDLRQEPAAIAAALRPKISIARAEHLLRLSRSWLREPPRVVRLPPPDDLSGRLAHVAAVRRLYHSLFNIVLPESDTRLSVWAMSEDDLRYLGGQVSERLRRIVARLGEGDQAGEPRVVMQLVGRMFAVTEALEGTGAPRAPGAAPAEHPSTLPSSESPPGPRIMAYWGLSHYLTDRFRQRKVENPSRTFTTFGKIVGLTGGAVGSIVHGSRPLTEEYVSPFGRHLGLTGDELAYFKLLAEAERAECPVRLTAIRAEMVRLRLKYGFAPMEQDQVIFYARWFYSVIREMAFWTEFRPEPAWVASRLRPRIPVAEAAEALSTLTRLGHLVPDAAGVPRPSGPVVALPDAVRGAAETYLFHYAADLAEHALLTTPPNELFMDGYCLSVPLSRVQEVLDGVNEIQTAAARWLNQRSSQAPVDRVGAIFLDATPLTWPLRPR